MKVALRILMFTMVLAASGWLQASSFSGPGQPPAPDPQVPTPGTIA